MKIGILQAGHSPDEVRDELGDYGVLFERLLAGRGFAFETFSVVDGLFPEGPAAADGWLITGSRHGVYDDLPWIPRLEDLIRGIHAAGLPLIGICFGHQLIAQALGGRVEKFSGGWAVGRQDYEIDGHTMTLNAWHQDQVTRLPTGARRIGTNPFCENAAFAIGDTILTIQPHPEFETEMVDALITHRAPGRVPPALIDAARASLARPTDNPGFADLMAAHFRQGAHDG